MSLHISAQNKLKHDISFNQKIKIMATITNPSLQGASGKIDGHVAYTVGKKTYLRKLADNIHNPRSKKQMAQRTKLPGAQTLYKAIRGSRFEQIYAIVAKEEERRSGYHWFLHANMNIFGENYYIDYPRLQISAGSQQLPFGLQATDCQPDKLELSWKDNTTTTTAQANDLLIVAAIFDNEPYQPVILDDTHAFRRDEKASIAIPEGTWTTVHLYCFFTNEEASRYSPCMYFSISKP